MQNVGLKNRIEQAIEKTELVRKAEVAHTVTLKLMEIFLDAVPETRRELLENQLNVSQLVRTVHKLKGAAGFVGATRLKILAADLEEIADLLTSAEISYYIAVMQQVLMETEVEMNRQINGGKAL